jgi:hypothetical protein
MALIIIEFATQLIVPLILFPILASTLALFRKEKPFKKFASKGVTLAVVFAVCMTILRLTILSNR